MGECGLDKTAHALEKSPWDVQLRVFEEHLSLAEELKRPVIVHCVRAFGPLREVLERHKPSFGVLLHSWTGPAEMVKPLAALGAYFSMSGAVCNPASTKLRESAAAVPLDRLLVETDAPDQYPYAADEVPVPRSEGSAPLNEPRHVLRVLGTLSELRGEPVELLAARTLENAQRFSRDA